MTAPNVKQQQSQKSAPNGNTTTTTAVKGDMPPKAGAPDATATGADGTADQNVPNGNAAAAEAANGVAAAATKTEPTTTAVANGDATADGAAAAAQPEDGTPEAEAKKKEDELLAKGQAIAKTRHLLARAFTKPAEEPALPKSHHDYLLAEMKWLAIDFNLERIWKQTTALAIGYELASKQGVFGLKPPPKEARTWHDDIKRLRSEAAKDLVAMPTSGRRSATAAAKAEAALAAATGMKLDPSEDPVFADLDVSQVPGTPPLAADIALVYRTEEDFSVHVQETLMKTDLDRIIKAEVQYRSYQFEYEASLVSHLLAVQEQQQQANTIADLGGFGYGIEEDEEQLGLGGKKQKRRQKGGNRAGGYLLDDFAALGEDEFLGPSVGTKRTASKANLDSVYLHKNRVRKTSYRDTDGDYELANETGGRYSTRRATGALRTGSGRGADRGRRPGNQRDGPYPYQGTGAAQRQRLQPGGPPGLPYWSPAEKDLLLAVVHEFGLNWTIISEVLSQSLSLQGIYRTPGACKQRFRQLTQQEGVDYSEDRAFSNLANHITKQHARELLASSLPVRDEVLRPLLEMLVQIGAAAKDKKAMEDRRNEALRTRRQDMHQSYITVLNGIMTSTGGRHLSPLELGTLVSNAYQQQAQQQKMFQQQAQQAQAQMQQAQQQQQQQQQQQAAAVAAQAQPGMPAVAGQPAVAVNGVPPQQAAALGVQQQQQPQPGTAAVATGSVAAGSAGGTPNGQPMAQLPPGTATPGASALPVGVQPGMPQGATPSAVPGVVPPAAAAPAAAGLAGKPPIPQPPQISIASLTQILQSGRMPNGQELTPEQRHNLEARRDHMVQATLAARNAAVAQAAAVAAGGGAAAAAGPSAASVAAMQATQQAAALQAGTRPALPANIAGLPMPGVYAQPGAVGAGAPQAGVLPQQIAGAGIAVAGNAAVMQQQQLLMAQQQAQMAQQQQAAAAAAVAVAKQANQGNTGSAGAQ